MKTVKLIYEPKAMIEFTRQEVETLMVLAKAHYSGDCRSLAEQGGLLFGLNNTFILSPRRKLTLSWALTFRDVDLLRKVCENYDAPKLWDGLTTALHAIEKAAERLNR